MKTWKDVRKELNMTLDDMSYYLGISSSSLSRKESGKRKMNISQAIKIIELYKEKTKKDLDITSIKGVNDESK